MYPVLEGPEVVTAARELAMYAHKDQYRRDGVTPYLTHVEAVEKLFAYHWGSTDEWNGFNLSPADYYPGRALSLIHDVAEPDAAHRVSMQMLREKGLGFLEPDLFLLTHETGSYLDYILAIKAARKTRPMAFLVKLCDMEHNGRSARGSQLAKYQLARHILLS